MATKLWNDAYILLESGRAGDAEAEALVLELLKTPAGVHEIKTTMDWGGNTLAQKAAAFGCRATLARIMRNGIAELHHKNTNEETAFQLAEMNDHEIVMDLINDPKKATSDEAGKYVRTVRQYKCY